MRICYLVLILIFCVTLLYAQKPISNKENQILKLVDKNYGESIGFLKKTVNINSGTNNVKGVREVGRLFEDAFTKTGLTTQWIDMPPEMKRAGHLFAEHKGKRGKRLLL